jgi:hypothetical protein
MSSILVITFWTSGILTCSETDKSKEHVRLITCEPPTQWVPGALSLGIKYPVCEADHSPQSSAKVKKAWSYTSTPPVRLHGMVLS